MNKILTIPRVKQLSYIVTIIFLLTHITLLFIFMKFHVTPMTVFNVFSVAFYVTMLFLIHKALFLPFVIGTYLEICLHMGLAVYFTGWDAGFQITLIGICILLTYSEYVGRSLQMRYVHSILLAPLAMLVYLGSYIIHLHHSPAYVMPDAVNTYFHIAWTLIVFGIVLAFLQIFVFITTRSQEVLSHEVVHDELTGLPNRVYIRNYFRQMESAEDRSGYWIAIADLDDFKAVNDTYGHNCGDYVLKTVAKQIQSLSVGVEVCRWGGEEFLIIGHRSLADAMDELERLRARVETYPFSFEGTALHLTVTIGLAWLGEEQSIQACIGAADRKLYEGKGAGKNRVCA